MRNALKILIISVFLVSCTKTYAGRYLWWNFCSITDYKKFPYRQIETSSPPFLFRTDEKMAEEYAPYLDSVEYSYRGERKESDLDSLLRITGTTAFIVIKDDVILYERYFNDYTRDSINRSFSISKSFISALVGIAIEEGHINGVDDFFTDYIPELKGKGFDRITIRHLLTMTSGLEFQNSIFPWSDTSVLYMVPDLRHYVLTHLSKKDAPGKHFHYNSYNTLLLSIVLERTTRRSVSAYLEEKIWKPLGMEYPASWSLNSEADGLESAPSGLNARAIDFAKFARLYITEGKWNGRQIIPQEWVKDSITPLKNVSHDYYPCSVKEEQVFYKYHWWGHPLGSKDFNVFASGHLGQLVYIAPKKKLIIVRFGKKTGNIDLGWYEVAKGMAGNIP